MKTACAHQPVITPDPQSPNHELVTCSACGHSKRRAKHVEAPPLVDEAPPPQDPAAFGGAE